MYAQINYLNEIESLRKLKSSNKKQTNLVIGATNTLEYDIKIKMLIDSWLLRKLFVNYQLLKYRRKDKKKILNYHNLLT